jgi:hypothetical protein
VKKSSGIQPVQKRTRTEAAEEADILDPIFKIKPAPSSWPREMRFPVSPWNS